MINEHRYLGDALVFAYVWHLCEHLWAENMCVKIDVESTQERSGTKITSTNRAIWKIQSEFRDGCVHHSIDDFDDEYDY